MIPVLLLELLDLRMKRFLYVDDRGSEVLMLLFRPQERPPELDMAFGVEYRPGVMMLGRLADFDAGFRGTVPDHMLQPTDLLLDEYAQGVIQFDVFGSNIDFHSFIIVFLLQQAIMSKE